VPERPAIVHVPLLRGPNGRRLRVGHLTTVGISQAKLLATELRVDIASGLDTVALSAPDEYVPDVEALGVEFVSLPSLTRAWDPRRDAVAARQLGSILRTLALDVLHTHNPKTGILGRLLGRAAGIPVVVNTCHGLWAQPTDSLGRRGFVLGLEVAAARASDAELYQNAEDRRTLSRWVPQWRARVVGNGTDLSAFGPDAQARSAVRAEWGVGADDLLVGGVGRLVAEKGIAEFAEAAEKLAARAQFVWVGPRDADKPDSVEASHDVVRFVGGRDDMAAVYNAFDVFVLPSYREGFSRSGMEAAATGLPLVLSDIRGCREVGRHEQEALLVPAGDAAALTMAVERLLDDGSLRQRLGAAARRRALAEFDQVAVAALSLETYAAVARRKNLGWSVMRRPWSTISDPSLVEGTARA
jgi:glycosyltransferase involved in cell wall biosynthesis